MRLSAGLLIAVLVGWLGFNFCYRTTSAANRPMTPAVTSAATSAVTYAVSPGARPFTANIAFPKSQAVIDVTKPPFNAKGDGITDDTDALQRALLEVMGTHRILYLPSGTYLVSKTLNWSNNPAPGRQAWGFNYIQGQNPLNTIIRLKDSTFTDPSKPATIMWCGGFGSADWFHNYIHDVTFDVGTNNPGAIGLQFYSNNTGALRRVRIVSQDGKGVTGLDLSANMNGPLLVQDVTVTGFENGITTGNAVNSQTFEYITLKNQTKFGLDNAGQAITIRGLLSENNVPSIRSYGLLWLMDSELKGSADGEGGNAKNAPAIINYNYGRIGLRNVATSGYARAIGDVETPDWVTVFRISGIDKPGSLGPNVTEYFSHPGTAPFGAPIQSIGLPVEETPDAIIDPPSTWAVVDTFGADPTGKTDSTAAIQKALDSGATTVFFPGAYTLSAPVHVRGKVRRLVGTGNWIDYKGVVKPNVIIGEGDSPTVHFEQFQHFGGGISINADRTVVMRSVGARILPGSIASRLFLEDFGTDDLRLAPGQKLWARQLNIENEGTHLTLNNADAWILGYKTERGGTLLHALNKARAEVFGNFSYTTTAGALAPMFVTDNASVFAFFREVCYNGDPYKVLIRETLGSETKEILPGNGTVTPYVSGSSSTKAPK